MCRYVAGSKPVSCVALYDVCLLHDVDRQEPPQAEGTARHFYRYAAKASAGPSVMSAHGKDAPRPSAPEPSASSSPPLHFVLVVLGDVGRSPRMQYHALSLMQEGHRVTLVGYVGEDIIPALKEFQENNGDHATTSLLRVVRFSVPAPKFVRRIRPVYFVWRILSLALCLLWILVLRIPDAVDCILVQNPPALPLLAVVYAFRYLQERGLAGKRRRRRRPAVIVDWHNLGYSMLGPGGFRRLAEVYEHLMAPLADGHFTVTEAMKEFLVQELGLAPSSLRVLPDCPPSIFQPLPFEKQHAILSKLHFGLSQSIPAAWEAKATVNVETTILTERNTATNVCRPRRGRPALVTSSTSWTPDEDFGVLLSALLKLDARITNEGSSLRVVVVVTGKGPQKQEYEEKMSRLILNNVAIQTLWLEPVDYPKLLACADVGVSLHTSTSGLDLPMKVLDLFGCRVPVCALNFACLSELVQDGANGRVFESDSQLSDLLWELLSPLTAAPDVAPHEFGALATYSANLKDIRRWDDNWKENALPVLLQATSL